MFFKKKRRVIKNSPAESFRQELIFYYLNSAPGDLLKTKSDRSKFALGK